MHKGTIGIFVILTLLAGAAVLAQEEERSLSLTLEDCILKALKNNIGVAIEVLNPELADISVSRAKEKYLPSLSFSFNRRDTITASSSFLEAADVVSTLTDNYSAEITQLIPTGANFSIALAGSTTDTNRRAQTINPRYNSQMTFSFSQPLLRDFGLKINRRDIIIARNNLDISENQFKRTLQQTVYDVEEAYWNLVYSIETLKVRQQSLKLALDLLEKNRRSVEVGTMAPIEILSAESAVATREADILQAESQVKDNEDLLRTILNLAAEGAQEDLEIIPVDKPDYRQKEITLEEALRSAMDNRPDLQGTRIDLENKELDLNYAKNQLLPGLNLTASYWSPGVSGTEVIYDPRNPFGAPIDSIPHPGTDAWKDTFSFKFNNWTAGITLDLPLNNFLSRANYAQAKVNLEQSMLRLKNQEQQIFLEIKSAVRAVETNYKRVQAYKVARELAERKLTAEEEKLKVGLTTNYFVLQYQTDLATALSTELKAIIDYNLSIAQLNRAMGISLKEKNIKFSEFIGR